VASLRRGSSVKPFPAQDNRHPFTTDTDSVSSVADSGRWWTADEAATYLGCARVTVYRAMKSGRLRAKKFGREWRTRKEWIDQGALLDVR